MKVLVTSKHSFDHLLSIKGITEQNIEQISSSVCFISINGSDAYSCGDPDQIPYIKNNKANVLVQFFDDITEVEKQAVKDEIKYKGLILFSEEQAAEIIKFMDANKDKKTCIVHCAAGIARSGAVGEFINDYINGGTAENYREFKKNNPYTNPNGYVLRALKRALIQKTA